MANGMIFGHRLEELTDGVTVFRNGAGKPMPLSSTDIDIQISSGLAVVVTTRKFSNAEDVPIEAILTMPVGFNATVTGLSAMIDGRKLRGEARAREEARENYEAAIDKGKMAVLHEEALRGIHVLSVGQLAPGKEVEVELRMVMPLAPSENGPFLRLPMTAGQLYGSSPLQPADDLIIDAHVRHEATLTIRADGSSLLLAGRGSVQDGKAITVDLDRAIEVVVNGGTFGTVTGVSADGHQVRIDLKPQKLTEQNLKLAILVDRSGSTGDLVGGGTETLLAAMQSGLVQALTDIGADDHIAIWQFSDDCQCLGHGRGTEVLQILKKLDQPGGGTRIGAAIRGVAESGVKDILVLTDGQTWETLPDLAAQLNIRISAVLVGRASLDANIGHLCALTGGELFYVPDAEVGWSVRLALNSMRSSRPVGEITLSDGRPSSVQRCIGGVDVIATWSDAMEVTGGTDIGRFAAWLCLGQMVPEEARALAVGEGLCSHITSLVLVDEAGEASAGLSETRKVPLTGAIYNALPAPMALARHVAVSHPMPSMSSAAMVRDTPSLIQKIGQFLRPGTKERRIAGREARRIEGNLRKLAESIDWDAQAARFARYDFDGLTAPQVEALVYLEELPAVLNVWQNMKKELRRALLAYIALRFMAEHRSAKRFAVKVLYGHSAEKFIGEFDELFFYKRRE